MNRDDNPKKSSEHKGDFPRPTLAFLYTGMIFVVIATSEKLGFSKYSIPAIDPIPWSEFFSNGLIKSLIVSVSFFGLYYGYSVYKYNKSKRQ